MPKFFFLRVPIKLGFEAQSFRPERSEVEESRGEPEIAQRDSARDVDRPTTGPIDFAGDDGLNETARSVSR